MKDFIWNHENLSEEFKLESQEFSDFFKQNSGAKRKMNHIYGIWYTKLLSMA